MREVHDGIPPSPTWQWYILIETIIYEEVQAKDPQVSVGLNLTSIYER